MKCSTCDAQFDSRSRLDQHKMRSHVEPTIGDAPPALPTVEAPTIAPLEILSTAEGTSPDETAPDPDDPSSTRETEVTDTVAPLQDQMVSGAFSPDDVAQMLIAVSKLTAAMAGTGDAGVFQPVEADLLAVFCTDYINERFGQTDDPARTKMIIGCVLVLSIKAKVYAVAIKRKREKRLTGQSEFVETGEWADDQPEAHDNLGEPWDPSGGSLDG